MYVGPAVTHCKGVVVYAPQAWILDSSSDSEQKKDWWNWRGTYRCNVSYSWSWWKHPKYNEQMYLRIGDSEKPKTSESVHRFRSLKGSENFNLAFLLLLLLCVCMSLCVLPKPFCYYPSQLKFYQTLMFHLVVCFYYVCGN